ncbi:MULTISPECIES: carbohydrate ABC transporter permease [unclassified Mesorhizobium]|uniref:carbohydrate ABC transporter permease n=1 Tax=unclassified Mesorhizobium TaxID=325217 RepID=UPI000FD7345A|nr:MULTISPECIES: carbohydrate ABC transporter permease [unclassified Mesorhizobium]TGQ05008.1 carbohydrate ABC transporter permease [Mesorhizobium sp. M2E.F.Ca.ET.219.01.1.1]TGS14307.1 carbohydrate ABC transporter permease [Mesorhizobium sp. M2E.F.Ca.ET.209.01.1.1]TGT65550.1 carbohydrate ABC transporter permease [Mesorhizobium sp. M2E.F.Ca.ET.166.01.1.1]TGV97597.1 carbohydrate ABC transporter permease [Mesorhizobium sp. M2E.F.Ca.ET.154.01.1.1]
MTREIQPSRSTELPPWSHLTPNKVNRWSFSKVFSNIVISALSIFFAVPMLWLALASVDKNATFQTKLPVLTAEHYIVSLESGNLAALRNSLVISLVASTIGTVAAFFAAYSFSRHHIVWKGPILLGILFLSGVPITILIVPMYEMFSSAGLLTMFPTAVLLGVTALPFQIYLIKNFIDAIPRDLEEAAYIERAKTWHVLWSVILPLTMPGLASAALFGFVNAWGSFLIPLVLISSDNQQAAPVRLFGFVNATSIDYGAIAAYSIIYSLPVVVLYLALSRQFKAGFVLGGAVR